MLFIYFLAAAGSDRDVPENRADEELRGRGGGRLPGAGGRQESQVIPATSTLTHMEVSFVQSVYCRRIYGRKLGFLQYVVASGRVWEQ